MGMYTKLVVDLRFKDYLPDNVVLGLKIMVGELSFEDFSQSELPNHRFFETSRWKSMLRTCSYYHTPFSLSELHYDSISKRYYLTSSSDFKNYDGEINQFFDFISDYVEVGFLGYSLYEEDETPTLYFLSPYGNVEKVTVPF